MPVTLNRILRQVVGQVVGQERPGPADMCDSVWDPGTPAIPNGILCGPSGQVGVPLGDDRRCAKSVQ